MENRILIAGGGTGGHVYPALATIEALKDMGTFEFLYIGGRNGIETRIVPGQGIPMKTIWISGFQRYLTWKNLLFPVKLLVSLMQSWLILRRFKPAVALGTGGYVTGPVLYMAAKMNIPVIIQEQDAYPGVTTRLLAKYARRICLAYEGALDSLKTFADRIIITGNPVRKNVAESNRNEAIKNLSLEEDLPVLFVFGGSQGARSINQALIKILPELLGAHPLQVIWQTGEREYETVQTHFTAENERVKILPYIRNMADCYAAADMIISRAGAITLAELALVKKPVILVPYPHAAAGHQLHNAQWIASNGAALVVTEKQHWERDLKDSIEKLLNDETLRRQMAAGWKKLAKPDAARHIAVEVIKLMKGD